MVQKIIKPFSARLLQRMLGRFQYGALQEKYGNESKEEGSWEFKSACNDLGYIEGRKHATTKKWCLTQYVPRAFFVTQPTCQTLVRWKLFTSHIKKKKSILFFFFRWKYTILKGIVLGKKRKILSLFTHLHVFPNTKYQILKTVLGFSLYVITMNGVWNFQALERMWKHHKKRVIHKTCVLYYLF